MTVFVMQRLYLRAVVKKARRGGQRRKQHPEKPVVRNVEHVFEG